MNVRENSQKPVMVINSKKPDLGLLIKKRSNQWQNEVHKAAETHNFIPISYGDRFIPRRYSLCNIDRNQKFLINSLTKDVLKSRLSVNYWRQNCFKLALNNSFDIKERRVLEFKDPVMKDISPKEYNNNNVSGYDWPCKPRSKPLAFSDTTHDLPGFDLFFDQNLVDWSVNGQIIASFGQDVIVWKRSEDITLIFNIKRPRSLAYCPNGRFLAIGCKACEYPVLELWNISCTQQFLIVSGKVFHMKHTDVQCIEWSKSGEHIVCGTNFGTLFVLSVPELKVFRKMHKHKLPVTILRFSPTMRYLASGDAEGNIVIYNWNSCDVYLLVRSRRKLNIVFDWHPWNGVDLAISEDTPASIVILHVPSKNIVAFYQRKDSKIIINYVTFSKITGELLVSISKRGVNGTADFKILVMSSLDRIVDLLKIPEGGARFMMWSPDGTRLATAGDDETLTIWNFYPVNKNNYFRKSNLLGKGAMLKFGKQFKMWTCLK